METFIEVAKYILFIIVGGFALYYRYSEKLREVTGNITKLILEAEEEYKGITKSGNEKFQYVVSVVYGMLPPVAQKFVPQSLIESIVQSTFDYIESYAKMQLEKVADKLLQEPAAANPETESSGE